jgi:hypothetical protein
VREIAEIRDVRDATEKMDLLRAINCGMAGGAHYKTYVQELIQRASKARQTPPISE